MEEAPSGWGDLKPREQRFLLAYCNHGNAAAAARNAGYASRSAKQIGAQLLTRHDLLRVLHQMSHKLGCSLENKIVRQEQLATAMAGVALDPKRKMHERISAAKAASQHDALLAGLRGQLKLRAPLQPDNPTANDMGDFRYTSTEIARLREQWKIVNPRREAPTLEMSP